MSSEKGTLVKNVDDPKFISEIIDNKISIKENYIWNMLGTISSSLISVILLLLASRLLDSQNSDIFSIAYALSQQFFIWDISRYVICSLQMFKKGTHLFPIIIHV